jgi:hypothetical protein
MMVFGKFSLDSFIIYYICHHTQKKKQKKLQYVYPTPDNQNQNPQSSTYSHDLGDMTHIHITVSQSKIS